MRLIGHANPIIPVRQYQSRKLSGLPLGFVTPAGRGLRFATAQRIPRGNLAK